MANVIFITGRIDSRQEFPTDAQTALFAKLSKLGISQPVIFVKPVALRQLQLTGHTTATSKTTVDLRMYSNQIAPADVARVAQSLEQFLVDCGLTGVVIVSGYASVVVNTAN